MTPEQHAMYDAATSGPTITELTELSELANRQLFLEERIDEIENLLAEAKEQLRLTQEQYIPELMGSIGMSEFKLSNGYKITIKRDVFASIRKDFLEQAINWLDTNNLGGIVKDKVEVNFGRGEINSARSLMDFCTNNNLNAEEKLSVHPQTLKATVKEQLTIGKEFPEEFFSIGPIVKSIIKTK